jgi:hypothetical protein
VTQRRRLPPRFRHEPFTSADAIAKGVDEHRLRASDLVAVHRGARSHAVPVSTIEHVRALQPLLGPGQAFSHTTAASIWGIPLPRRFESPMPMHVTTVGSVRRMRRPGVVGHRAAPPVLVERFRGVSVTEPATTWVTLATMLTVDELVISGDAVVGELRLSTTEALRAAVEARPGARGTRRLRQALEEVRPGSRSPGETRLRLVLTRGGLPHPELNHDVVHRGRWVARVDFAYPAERLAIEYESDLHRTDAAAYRKDITRGERLKDAGWWLARATALEVGPHQDEFVRRIDHLLTLRAGEIR